MSSIRLWHIAVFVTALIVFAIARAPVSFFVPSRAGGFEYARAVGTVWSARFENARLGPFGAGSVTWRLSLGKLLSGKFVADVAADGPGLSGEGRLLANWGGDRRVIAHTLRLVGAPLAPDLVLAGETTANGLDIFFDDGACAAAAGALQSNVLTRNGDLLRWRGPELSGAAVCAGNDAELSLSGQTGGEEVRAVLTLRSTGAGAWRAEVQSAKPETQAALAAAGFAMQSASGQTAKLVKEAQWAPL